MKVSDYIVQFLHDNGVTCVFEMSGGMITHILDSLYKNGKIRIVSTHHEQAAAFAADAFGRMTGVPGVAMATSGPGATNLLTGIGSCYFDSSPALFITGQVNRNEIKGNRKIRQLGFQETDIVSIALPITKAAWQAQTPEEIPELLKQAFVLATSGRPGPVLLDIPMDVQRADISIQEIANAKSITKEKPPLNDHLYEKLFLNLRNAKRPLTLVGGGVRAASAIHLLRNFIHKIRIPVVFSLMAVDILPYDDPLRIGMIGSYGNRWANLTIAKSDVLIVIGSRLDVRQTGSQTTAFKGDKKIFHIDCEEGEINNRVIGCNAIIADIKEFLTTASRLIEDQQLEEQTEWLKEINTLKQSWPDTAELATSISGINPNIFMHKLSKISTQAAAYVSDVGQHQMWAAQSLELTSNQRFLTSGGMGSMGFGLPAAIGVAFAVSPKPVVVIAGDGGFQSNIHELQTVVRNQLPMKIVVLNNHCHGMVRQFQESYFEGRYQSTFWGYSAPDFEAISTAYGIPSKTIENENEVEQALQWLWSDPTKPALLQVIIDTFANAYPKIAFGSPNTEMEPFTKSPKNTLDIE